jgi:hypothetical protein
MRIYSNADAAHELGVSPSTLIWHRGKGLIPAPEVEVGLRLCYSEVQMATLRSFYGGRKKYERPAVRDGER